MNLDGKVAMVFGASAGIGRAYAWALAEAGATVVATARTLGQVAAPERNTLADVVAQSRHYRGRVFAQHCDVEIEDDIVQAIEQTAINFGRIDIIVNNAVLMPMFPALEAPTDMWDKMMRINLRGAYIACRQAAPHMIRQGSGSIINITAKAGDLTRWKPWPNDQTLVYATSKAALNRMTVALADELKPHGIAVNALSPGVVATDTALAATPNLRDLGGKPDTPEVLGPALVYLAGQTASTITGQILYTDEFGTDWPAQAQA